MEQTSAVKKFAAIAHESRLQLLRQLIQAGATGKTAGKLAESGNIAPNTASAQLLNLSNADLVYSQREGREIRYFVNFESIAELMKFLIKDCCGHNAALSKKVIKECTR